MHPSLEQIIAGVLLAAGIALAARRLRLLAVSGARATFLLGSLVFGVGGVPWSLPLLTFFILSSLLSRYTKRKLGRRFAGIFEKGSTRDAAQVWANGGVAGAVLLLHLVFPDAAPNLYLAYLGALTAAAADTWGTETGTLAAGRVVSILTFRPLPAGTSGGVSLAGTGGAIIGAMTVALAGVWWTAEPVRALGIAVVAGVVGMLADSVAGLLLQARYRCCSCRAVTEQSSHCGSPAGLIGGYRRITNDAVNVLCCLVGAAVALLLAG